VVATTFVKWLAGELFFEKDFDRETSGNVAPAVL
jgi:hypothetical protein